MSRFLSKMIALAAAYAVALATVLPALAGLSPAIGVGAATLCTDRNTGSTDRGLPGKPQSPCPGGPACAMPGCPGAALGVAEVVTLVVPAALTASPLPRPAGPPIARPRLGADHPARGPPAA